MNRDDNLLWIFLPGTQPLECVFIHEAAMKIEQQGNSQVW